MALVKLGSRGKTVVKLQQLLIDKGYLNPPADGIFGQGTHRALTRFEDGVEALAVMFGDAVLEGDVPIENVKLIEVKDSPVVVKAVTECTLNLGVKKP